MNTEQYVKNVKAKIEDYTRFIYILLAVSTFLYIGVLIGMGDKSPVKIDTMMGVLVLFLGAAFYFAWRTKKLKKSLFDEK
ncbi:YrhC family protein [Priestia koreensis]|uniref:YrhC-like protein n=1 Tax=Priestia koreensis TaxID=284581 RepID=A0A0M0KYW9_9BACI|nr:YrhC family protein [Priestia koreensis]KOO43837.1 hypothetical protein AMD01_13930 [Priestia koreensis]MCM3002576.1 YrhC family protein [Priestia koreensis]UNL84283.1 hypothetical protein IE339_19395 [Priestia koreensis]